MKIGINTLLILIIGVLIIAALTNPSEDQFINYLNDEIERKADTKVEIFLNDLLGKPLLATATQRNDYIFFSKFTVSRPKNKIIYVGLFSKIFINIQ